MNKVRTSINILTTVLFTLLLAVAAQAQATRTWVSGVGDDANPCSRTAPCKTFAGAISKTAVGGEIDALDPGGFGAVTITKSITIDGTQGAGFGSILAAGTNGIIINITTATNDTVTIRNLSINGAGTGLNGIRILSVGTNAVGKVYVENCQIFGFTLQGIDDQRSQAGKLFVTDTIIRNNNQSGIQLLPASNLLVQATLSNVRLEGNGNAGITVNKGAKATVTNSVSTNNNSFNFHADGAAGAVELNVESSTSAFSPFGFFANTGATVRVSNNYVTGNGTAFGAGGAGAYESFQNNKVRGNGVNNGGNAFPVGTALFNGQ